LVGKDEQEVSRISLKLKEKILKQHFWAGGIIQVVEGLPSKHRILSSNPNTAKNLKKKKKLLVF
jgi:hypothetical protein